MDSIVIAVIVIILLYILWKKYGVKVYRFHRPTCPYCVQTQKAWDEFKWKSVGEFAWCCDVDVSDKGSAELSKKFNVKSVPTIIAVKENKIYQYQGDRSCEDLVQWVSSL